MNWLNEFADRVQRDVPIGPQTWFRLGGSAKYVFHPSDEADLAAFLRRTHEDGPAIKVLGRGANVLVSDEGFDGVVVRLDAEPFQSVTREGMRFILGAGVDLIPFARRVSVEGLAGLEAMAGIPATVGGALCMNAGGAPGDFGDVVVEARVVELTGAVQTFSRARLGLGYRQSAIGDRIVTSVTIELHEDDPGRTMARFNKFDAMKRSAQPIADKSAGCIFKNPPGQAAGALIDQAGLKGTCCGGASVSDRHANFIVAEATAKASDVLQLIDIVRERVQRKFDIELELEIDVWRPVGKEALVS